ncbi:MAG: hypothetical protein EPO32_08820 [Anaerolineae bacterium]|nr:MAG: hypothetical protein EPO32_08820 [Anaerolineae bacterium]
MSDFNNYSGSSPEPQQGRRAMVILAAAMAVLVMAAGAVFFMAAAPQAEEPPAGAIEFTGMLPIEARLNEFLVLAGRGDYEAAYGLLSEAGRRGWRFESFRAQVEAADLAGYARLEINSAELSEQTRIAGTAYFADGTTREFEAWMQQDSGEWFLNAIEFGE